MGITFFESHCPAIKNTTVENGEHSEKVRKWQCRVRQNISKEWEIILQIIYNTENVLEYKHKQLGWGSFVILNNPWKQTSTTSVSSYRYEWKEADYFNTNWHSRITWVDRNWSIPFTKQLLSTTMQQQQQQQLQQLYWQHW